MSIVTANGTNCSRSIDLAHCTHVISSLGLEIYADFGHIDSHSGTSAFYLLFLVPLPLSRAALYLEKLGEDHLEESLREMDDALARMIPG